MISGKVIYLRYVRGWVTLSELFQSETDDIHTCNEQEKLLLTDFRILPSDYQERLIGYLQCLHDESNHKK